MSKFVIKFRYFRMFRCNIDWRNNRLLCWETMVQRVGIEIFSDMTRLQCILLWYFNSQYTFSDSVAQPTCISGNISPHSPTFEVNSKKGIRTPTDHWLYSHVRSYLQIIPRHRYYKQRSVFCYHCVISFVSEFVHPKYKKILKINSRKMDMISPYNNRLLHADSQRTHNGVYSSILCTWADTIVC